MPRLDGDSNPPAQKLWREVCALVPGEGMAFNRKTLEALNVTQRPKNRAFQFIAKVHLTSGAIAQPEPHAVIPNAACLKNVKKHVVTPAVRSI